MQGDLWTKLWDVPEQPNSLNPKLDTSRFYPHHEFSFSFKPQVLYLFFADLKFLSSYHCLSFQTICFIFYVLTTDPHTGPWNCLWNIHGSHDLSFTLSTLPKSSSPYDFLPHYMSTPNQLSPTMAAQLIAPHSICRYDHTWNVETRHVPKILIRTMLTLLNTDNHLSYRLHTQGIASQSITSLMSCRGAQALVTWHANQLPQATLHWELSKSLMNSEWHGYANPRG